MRELIVGMLETLGHHGIGVTDSEDVAARGADNPVDAVIARLSESDSDQSSGLLSRIRSHAPNIPLIAVTDSGEGERDRPVQAERMLYRPFRLDQLQDCLDSLAEPGATVSDTDVPYV